MCVLPIEIINKIFMYVSSPISKLLQNALFVKYYYIVRLIENNNCTLYTYWIKRKQIIALNTIMLKI